MTKAPCQIWLLLFLYICFRLLGFCLVDFDRLALPDVLNHFVSSEFGKIRTLKDNKIKHYK